MLLASSEPVPEVASGMAMTPCHTLGSCSAAAMAALSASSMAAASNQSAAGTVVIGEA